MKPRRLCLAAGLLAAAMLPARAVEPSAEAAALAQAVLLQHDHQGRAFAVVDKRQAALHVYDGEGRRLGSTPVLLGAAVGDDSVPGIGERPIAQILPHERTTPAGRFDAEPGRNTQGEDIVWIDYDAAVSMHRVRATNPKERRLQRLASATAADNRISYGCINVPVAFYEAQVRPHFYDRRGTVYVLPETRPVGTAFGWIAAQAGR